MASDRENRRAAAEERALWSLRDLLACVGPPNPEEPDKLMVKADHGRAFSKAAKEAKAALAALDAEIVAKNAPPKIYEKTIFECRTCSRSTWGTTAGQFDEPGWSWIENIDGPNAICPSCQEDHSSLDGLRETYPNAVVKTPT